jgi:outer membrane lipoprotein LolB
MTCLRVAALLLAVIVVAGCARAPIRGADSELLAAQAGREAALVAQSDWQLSGRIAISGEGDGGSGRLDWAQRGDDFIIQFSAPVSRQSWRLSSDAGGASLQGLEGGDLYGPSAEDLLQQATGWSMPVRQLVAWVRGARARGAADIAFGGDGLPALINQAGWRIEYRGWDEAAQPALPTRVFAESDGRRVRLVVDRWGPNDG